MVILVLSAWFAIGSAISRLSVWSVVLLALIVAAAVRMPCKMTFNKESVILRFAARRRIVLNRNTVQIRYRSRVAVVRTDGRRYHVPGTMYAGTAHLVGALDASGYDVRSVGRASPRRRSQVGFETSG